MRKLSKKISMLMVLAMLVSLFSGVVSASAASSWSFYNKTTGEIVAVKETIEMESNEFADFDLYKDGKTIDTDVYTVKYESSDADVVFVDAKNGKLRADKAGVAEAGDKAMITAVITNKTTNITARRSFYIEIAEDAVEYEIAANFGDEAFVVGEKYDLAAVVTADGEAVEATVVFTIDDEVVVTYAPAVAGEVVIVATATIDGEEYTAEFVCDVVEAEKAFELKQVSMTTVNVAFATEAAADDFVKNYDGNLAVSYTLKDSEDVIDDIASVKEVKLSDDKTVAQIVMFGNLITDATYAIAYADESATFVGAGVVPAEIKVVEKSYPFEKDGKLAIDVFNADGVNINGGYDGTVYTISWKVVSGDENKYYLTDELIYFYEKDVKVVVEATLDMGYDENDDEIADLTDKGTVQSVAQYTDSKIKEFSINGGNNWTAVGGAFNVFVDGNPVNLLAKFTRTQIEDWGMGASNDCVIAAGLYNEEQFTYTSSNPTVAMVNDGGLVTPNSAGTATIYVKNANGNTLGGIQFKVLAKRQLNSISLTAKSSKLSVGAGLNGFTDFITVDLSLKDQVGGDLFDGTVEDGALVDSSISLSYALQDGTDATQFFKFTPDPGNNTIKVEARAFEDDVFELDNLVPDAKGDNVGKGKTKSYRVTVKATDGYNNSQSRTFTFTVKDVDASKLASIDLDMKTSVDMKAVMDRNDGIRSNDSYDVDIKAVKKDNAGYFLGYESITAIECSNNKANVETATGGNYTVFITENNQAVNSNYDGIEDTRLQIVAGNQGAAYDYVKFNVIDKVDDTIDTISRYNTWGGSSFAVRLYQGMGTTLKTWDSKSLAVSDSSAAAYAVQKANVIKVTYEDDEISKDNLDAALKLFYAGKEIPTYKTADGNYTIDASYSTLGDKQQVFITSVTVNVDINAYNGAFEAGVYETVEIPVNKLFTIAD